MPEHVYDQADQDRTYHGVQDRTNDSESRLLVEQTAFGATERELARFLREIHEPEHSGFGWGYNGGGTSETAAAILADALDAAPERFSPMAVLTAEVDRRLREDFCVDVLALCADEFRLRRGAVLFPVKSAC